jgi:hypothetical protein
MISDPVQCKITQAMKVQMTFKYTTLHHTTHHDTPHHTTLLVLSYLIEHAAADCTGREGSRRPVKRPYNRIIETHSGYEHHNRLKRFTIYAK